MDELTAEYTLFGALLGLLAAVVALLVAYLTGFFRIPLRFYDEENEPVSGKMVIWVVAILLTVQYLLTPIFFTLGYLWLLGKVPTADELAASVQANGWFLILSAVCWLVAFGIYLRDSDAARRAILGKSTSRSHDICLGIMAWLLTYPWILAITNGLGWLIHGGDVPGEQQAVLHIRQLTPYPLLLALTGVAIIFVVPFIEELAFRGTLQQWIKRYLGSVAAVVITSILFALAHFSTAQGAMNYVLLPSLFATGLVLGFLRERQNALVAPIALHSTINAMSFFFILLQERFRDAFN